MRRTHRWKSGIVACLASAAPLASFGHVLIGQDSATPSSSTRQELARECRGNIETFHKDVIQYGVEYKLHIIVRNTTATVQFAGREFTARIDVSKSGTWKGRWIKRVDDEIYFSYLPEDGGTVKFKFSPDRWFSGNC